MSKLDEINAQRIQKMRGLVAHEHVENAIKTMRIVLAADESIRTGKAVMLSENR